MMSISLSNVAAGGLLKELLLSTLGACGAVLLWHMLPCHYVWQLAKNYRTTGRHGLVLLLIHRMMAHRSFKARPHGHLLLSSAGQACLSLRTPHSFGSPSSS
mmetsp:Transcript_16618/g.31422  ORF Transcript_16618/g.31422 Transcript_16618/m.31422 type:complete len:102 (-) Transcript_16618:676-981(-)